MEGNDIHFELFELSIDELYNGVSHIPLTGSVWETLENSGLVLKYLNKKSCSLTTPLTSIFNPK